MQHEDQLFEDLANQFRSKQLTPASHRLTHVAPLRESDVKLLAQQGSAEYRAIIKAGNDAIHNHKVGAVILAGGMATRFGYDRPKGLFPIIDSKSFLQLKIEWLVQQQLDIPIFIMTSFHTDDAIRAHLDAHHNFGSKSVYCFLQNKLPRLNPDGSRFETNESGEAFAAPGHGDFPRTLVESGLLQQFLNQGGRYLYFSNVDNLGASLEPAIVGWHIISQVEMTVEVAAKVSNDKGGAPARVGERIQLVESFAFPKDFDQDSIPYFNTASYVFTAEALLRPTDQPWYVVEKNIGIRPVIQFEHLAGDLSRTLNVGLLAVNRDERFIPVKNQADVPGARNLIQKKISAFPVQ
ncbi:MAG: hypothetical protein NVS4B8_06720 [Herpetosiphon sp.]